MVEPSFAERSLILHKHYLTGSRLIVSNAIEIRDSEVLTSEGRLVPYDYLVIATGHVDPLVPKTRAERLKQYQAGNFSFSPKHYVFFPFFIPSILR